MIAELLSRSDYSRSSDYSRPSESQWAGTPVSLLDMLLPNSCDDKSAPLIQGSEEVFS